MVIVRKATIQDIPVITEIYNEAILTTDATFDTDPKTVEERTAWFDGHGSRNPILVAEEDTAVIGWASLTRWSDRKAYTNTVEISVYVKDGYRGRGTGRKLMESIIGEGRATGLHTIISRIVAGNQASLHLHEALGFEYIGVMKEVGTKFGRLLDVHVMQLIYSPETDKLI